jgi:hypothetical protein
MMRQMSVDCMVARLQTLEPYRTTKEARAAGARDSVVDIEYNEILVTLIKRCAPVTKSVAMRLFGQKRARLLNDADEVLWHCVRTMPNVSGCGACLSKGLADVAVSPEAIRALSVHCNGACWFIGYYRMALSRHAALGFRRKDTPESQLESEPSDRDRPNVDLLQTWLWNWRTLKRELINQLDWSGKLPISNLLFFERWEAAGFWRDSNFAVGQFASLPRFLEWIEQWLTEEANSDLIPGELLLKNWWDEFSTDLQSWSNGPKALSDAKTADCINRLLSDGSSLSISAEYLRTKRSRTKRELVKRAAECCEKNLPGEDFYCFHLLRRRQTNNSRGHDQE